MSRFDEIYDDITASIQKYAVDKRVVLLTESPGITYFDFDTVAEAHELPDGDLIGPAGLGLTEAESGIFEIVASVGVSTVNDPNLYRLRKMISKVYADLRPMKQIELYRHATTTPVGWAVIQGGTSITPINKAASRALQFVTFQALIDPSAPHRG